MLAPVLPRLSRPQAARRLCIHSSARACQARAPLRHASAAAAMPAAVMRADDCGLGGGSIRAAPPCAAVLPLLCTLPPLACRPPSFPSPSSLDSSCSVPAETHATTGGHLSHLRWRNRRWCRGARRWGEPCVCQCSSRRASRPQAPPVPQQTPAKHLGARGAMCQRSSLCESSCRTSTPHKPAAPLHLTSLHARARLPRARGEL